MVCAGLNTFIVSVAVWPCSRAKAPALINCSSAFGLIKRKPQRSNWPATGPYCRSLASIRWHAQLSHSSRSSQFGRIDLYNRTDLPMRIPTYHTNHLKMGKSRAKKGRLSVLKDKQTMPARYMKIGRFALAMRQLLQVRTRDVRRRELLTVGFTVGFTGSDVSVKTTRLPLLPRGLVSISEASI